MLSGRYTSKKSVILYPLATYLLIWIFWVLAWLLKVSVLDKLHFFSSSLGSFLYWTFSKIIIWILPYIIFLRVKNIKLKVFKTKDKSWITWGVLIGSFIAIFNIIYNSISKQRIWSFEFSYAFLNIATIAPLLEEFLFRGFLLTMLKEVLPFYIANIISSVCFLSIHIPGWFFMGLLRTNLLNWSFVSIFILSLLFGYACKKGGSVKASMIVHFLNNIS